MEENPRPFVQINNLPKIGDFCFTLNPKERHRITAFNQTTATVKEPRISQYEYLDQEKTSHLLNLKTSKEIYDFIASTLSNHSKGRPKDLFIQLISDVTKFCQSRAFDVEKTATVLSQFYQTHLYFTSGLQVSAEKIYIYFKELMMCHSLPFPPAQKKVFSVKEAKDILEFFCKIYLRNLPLVKYLCMPNFALYLNYEIPPRPVLHSTDKKKGKKGTDRSDKKKAKKSAK
uniref:Uncharacterized protein n=1 Tax=Dendroctonus ponderosae TaxID=77166 RepID=A0AAR5P9E1_DENPD